MPAGTVRVREEEEGKEEEEEEGGEKLPHKACMYVLHKA